MKTLVKTLTLLTFLSNCTTEGKETQKTRINIKEEVVFTPENFADSLSVASIKLTETRVVYTPDYVGIDYPMGDVPVNTGVCTDVIIRAYRAMGIDLQKELHEDIKNFPNRYPNIDRADHNIDHRRVPNLSKFFTEYGEVLDVSNNTNNYKAGDIIYWKLGGTTDHIGIVTHLKNKNGTPLIVHNICCGQNLEDCLFDYPIYKHFRFRK